MSSSSKKALLILSLTVTALLAAATALTIWSGPPAAVPVSANISIPASAADWGLTFQTEGQPPTGNVSAEDLSKYDAYYLGDTTQKVIYLTFDCGYENGNTEQILDALK